MIYNSPLTSGAMFKNVFKNIGTTKYVFVSN